MSRTIKNLPKTQRLKNFVVLYLDKPSECFPKAWTTSAIDERHAALAFYLNKTDLEVIIDVRRYPTRKFKYSRLELVGRDDNTPYTK